MNVASFLTRAALRSDLGHADDYEAKKASGAIILAKDTNRIMLSQRGVLGDFPLVWATTGGCMEPNEGPRTACRREIREETGYDGQMALIPLMVYSDGPSFMYYNFLAVIPWEFTPKKDEENNAFGWFKFGEWPEPTHPGFDRLLSNGISMSTVRNHLYRSMTYSKEL